MSTLVNPTTAGTANAVPLAGGTMTGELVVPDVKLSGLTGAVAAARLVGATATGAPTTGTFVAGDFVVDQTGLIWICTLAGSPGTWAPAGSGRELSSGALATAAQTVTGVTATDITGVTVTITVGTKPIHVEWGGQGTFQTSTATLPAIGTVYLLEDGVLVDYMQVPGVLVSQATRFHVFKSTRRNPSAASHTYKCQMLTSHANASITVPSVSSSPANFGIQAITEH